MVAEVPTRGMTTIYSIVGDLFSPGFAYSRVGLHHLVRGRPRSRLGLRGARETIASLSSRCRRRVTLERGRSAKADSWLSGASPWPALVPGAKRREPNRT